MTIQKQQVFPREIVGNLQTGANGPYTLQISEAYFKSITIWTTAQSGSSIAVTYSLDGGTSVTPVPMSQVGSNTGHYENTSPIIADLGEITVTVTGPAAGCMWGIR